MSCTQAMTLQRMVQESKKEVAIAARSARARKYARVMKFTLFVLILTAVWQDKRLAPPVHDGMQLIAGKAIEYIESNETLSEALDNAQKSYAAMKRDS